MKLWRKTLSPRPATASLELVPRQPPPMDWGAPQPSPQRFWMHGLLFLLTLVSMMVAGAHLQGVHEFTTLSHLAEGIPFAATLLGILTVHEFGHYFAARKWGVKASLPFFLPVPVFLGTLGAVIRIRSPIPHKQALMDIGAAGPLAGLVVAIGVCIVGLPQSTVVGVDDFYAISPIQLGSPLLLTLLSDWTLPPIESNQMLVLGPVAFAGWAGMFITAFNLLPVGQLDGGHIVYALFGRFHRWIARLCFGSILGLGIYGFLALMLDWPQGWIGWLVLALLLSIFGTDHPAPYRPHIPIDRSRRVVGYLCLVAFALCFTPVPLSNLYIP